MNQTESKNKVIRLDSKRMKKDNGDKGKSNTTTRVIAITSGKGGVGKTNIVANLGYAFCQLGKKVLILDADFGLGNIDILLGLAPKFNLSHVILGLKTIPQITIDGPGNLKILPASSGIQELSQLTNEQRFQLIGSLERLTDSFDILLIDTAAGISSDVLYFNATAQEIMVVISPEPTSMTDAYALMKVLSIKYSETHFKLLVNFVKSEKEAKEIFRQLKLVADKFLNISLEYVGCILRDRNITKSVRLQRLVSDLYPDSSGSKCFSKLAKNLFESSSKVPTGSGGFFWKHLTNNFEQ